MKGPKLKSVDLSGEKGVAPPRLKGHLGNLRDDDRTIVEWVIKNFVPSESGAGGTLTLSVCIGGVTKTATFLVTGPPQ